MRIARPARHARVAALALAGFVAALGATGALAGKPDNISESEMALIPPYCADANTFRYGDATTNTSPNAPKWVGMMGPGFWHIHHYCWALINLNRVQKAGVPATIQSFTREDALSDMNYVIRNTDASFVILPEIYTKMGEIYLQLKKPRDAEVAYAKAWQLRPDYWPPYAQWASFLAQSGQKARAREIAEEGLRNAPSSRTLRMLVRDLGGNPAASSGEATQPLDRQQTSR